MILEISFKFFTFRTLQQASMVSRIDTRRGPSVIHHLIVVVSQWYGALVLSKAFIVQAFCTVREAVVDTHAQQRLAIVTFVMAHLWLNPNSLWNDGIIHPYIGTFHAVDNPLHIQGLKQLLVEIINHHKGMIHEVAVIIKALAEINAEPVGGFIVPASRAI